jgi:hypothetical protein
LTYAEMVARRDEVAQDALWWASEYLDPPYAHWWASEYLDPPYDSWWASEYLDPPYDPDDYAMSAPVSASPT